MRRFVRFVVFGVCSPSLVAAGLEPMPAPTLRGRVGQWRRRGQWQEELLAEAKAWADANPMSPEEFMDICHRFSVLAFGDYDDDGEWDTKPQ